MKKISNIILVLVLFSGIFVLAKSSWAATHWVHPLSPNTAWLTKADGDAHGAPYCEYASDPGNSGACSGYACYCSLSYALASASAGDTIYIKGGNYNATNNDYLRITSSGTLNNGVCTSKITYAAAPGESPIFVGNPSTATYGMAVLGSCLKFDGLTIKGFDYASLLTYNGASYNEFTNMSFIPDPARPYGWKIIIGYDESSKCSTHNWFHHNYISSGGNSDPCGEGVDLIRIGMAQQFPSSCDNYNTFENNYIEYAAHSTLTTHSKYNVLRNNIFHNEPWVAGCTTGSNQFVYDATALGYAVTQGSHGHRVIDIGDADLWANNFTLVEGNRIGYGSPNAGNSAAESVSLSSPGNVLRYNYIYGAMGSGIYEKWQNASGLGSGAVRNRIFNNTIYHNGWGFDDHTYGHVNGTYQGQGIGQGIYNTCHGGSFDTKTCYGYGCTTAAMCKGAGNPVDCCTGGTDNNDGTGPTCNQTGTCSADLTGTVIKNNLLYNDHYGDICAINTSDPNCSPQGLDTVLNNWVTANGDPKFVNPSLVDPLNQNIISTAHGYSTTLIPNLALQSSSGAINGGTYLTLVDPSDSGSGTTLKVVDARYFQDGTWGSALAKASAGLGGTFQADWICLGNTPSTCTPVAISSASPINYTTNTITLANSVSRTPGVTPVWLYKDSSGNQVINRDNNGYASYGAAPYAIQAPPSVIYGDVSGDNTVSAYDAALVAQASVGLITFTTDQIKTGDVSGDGAISSYDAALIAQKAVGLISKFPVEL